MTTDHAEAMGAPDARPVPEPSRWRHGSLPALLERYALVFFLIVLIAFFAIWPETSETFLSAANVRTILANQAVVIIAALGALIPFVAGQFDISIGAVAILASFVVAALTTEVGTPVGVAIAAAVAAGALVGGVSGLVVAYLQASAIVLTLGAATAVAGLVILYSGSESIVGVPQSLIAFGSQNWLGVPRPLWLTAAVVLLVGYLLRWTVTGRQLLMIGENPAAAELVGVRTRRLILMSFVLGGALYAVAGTVLLARTGAASPSDGFGITIGVLTGIFLGSTTVRPGRFSVAGTIVGVLFVAVTVNGLTLAGASDWVEPVFTGAAVMIAVAVSSVLAGRRAS